MHFVQQTAAGGARLNAPPTTRSDVQLLNITISCASDVHNRYGIIIIIIIISRMPETMNISIDVILIIIVPVRSPITQCCF